MTLRKGEGPGTLKEDVLDCEL